MRCFLEIARLIPLGLLLGSAACGGEAPDGHPGQGVVRSVDVSARQVTIKHQDIPGFMKAMTMTFELAPGLALDGIEPGTTVDFRVKLESGTYTVTQIRRAESGS